MIELILDSIDGPTLFIWLFMPLYFIGFLILHKLIGEKKAWIWHLLGVLPIIVFIIFYGLNYTKGDTSYSSGRYMFSGIAALCILVFSQISRIKRIFTSSAIVSGFLVMAFSFGTILAVMVSGDMKFYNYTRMDWAESLDNAITTLDKQYVLRDHKQLDFEAIRSELVPRAEKAQAGNDKAEYLNILYDLCYELHDGHVRVACSDMDAYSEAISRRAGNDYGLSMVRLENGEFIAVCVDERSEAFKSGIENGTVITEWDGVPVEEAAETVKCYMPRMAFSSIENERFMQPIFLAGRGGESVEATFIDKQGSEKTVRLEKRGSYSGRLTAAASPFMRKGTHDNFHAEMLNDNCGYLSIIVERNDDIKDFIAFAKGEYPEIRDKVRKQLKDLEAQGMDRMIVDIRGNDGGMEDIANAVVSLFTDEEFYVNAGRLADKKVRSTHKVKVGCSGEFKELPVVVLVNLDCASSGDVLAYRFAKCPNVQMMGMTSTWNCAQAVAGNIKLTDSEFDISFASILTLGDNDEIIIDAGPDRHSSIALDVKIPLEKDYVLSLYNSEEDVELQYALDYIENKMK